MDKILSDKISPAVVAFYQAAGVFVYIVFVSLLFNALDRFTTEDPDFIAPLFFLTLLVLSAGITGTLVFGLPVYFTFAKNNVKRAIAILGYTFLYFFVYLLLAALAIITIF